MLFPPGIQNEGCALRDRFLPLPAFVLFFLVSVLPSAHSATDQEISKSYIALDYPTTIKLLEQRILEHKGKVSKDDRRDYTEVYATYLLLGQVYAWRVNRPDLALSKLEELRTWKENLDEAQKFPACETLYMAEICESRKEFLRAEEFYRQFLKELADIRGKRKDEMSVLIIEDLIRFGKYQLDGLHLKTGTARTGQPLLTRLKLSSHMAQLTPAFALLLVPQAKYLVSERESFDLSNWIRQSPPDLASMVLNYALIFAHSAGAVGKSSEEALEEYLSKYPEGYYSLQLRYLFLKFYRESEMNQKAERLVQDLERIGKKRKIELVIAPDRRFSSPEKTWETYRNGLKQGDMDLVTECYVPGRRSHRRVFEAMGKPKMMEFEKALGKIHKVKAGEEMAEYMIIRVENGKEISYGIYFHNLDGEWKMREF